METKTKVNKKIKRQITKNWFLIDAKGKVLGRLATKIATLLTGKDKVSYLPTEDSGDYVVVINAAKVAVTGRKNTDKMYYHYSGYPGGLKSATFKTLVGEKPEIIIQRAVWGMVPKTRLGKAVFKKLYVYSGEKHPHQAQKLEELKV